jgi:SAM-dependent methyltransferase
MEQSSELNKLVKQLLEEKPILMDAFDSSYLKDFHHTMRENFDVTSLKDPKLSEIIKITGISEDKSVQDLTNLLLNSLDENDFMPKKTTPEMKKRFKYTEVHGWDDLENVTASEDVEKTKEFLVKYSKQSGGARDIPVDTFERNWGRNPKLKEMQEDIIRKYIIKNPGATMLTIGPRWAAEITFLRMRFGIHVMGLDLFSTDESKVVIGDMHDMPIKDNTYDIVYEKNTYNKAYDIRKALDESVRILKPGGLLIYDECMDYTCGVNENARTNIKSHDWTISYLKDKIDKVLVAEEPPTPEKDKWWLNKVGLFIAKVK